MLKTCYIAFLRTGAMALMLALVGCSSKPDPSIILGNWRAESFKLDSVKVPIAPNFEVTRNEMILKSPDGLVLQRLPLSLIKAEGKAIELVFRDGFGVSIEFDIETRDRILFLVPLVGFTVAYNRT